MTLFKDRLPGTIRIKKKFAPSAERIRAVRRQVIAAIFIVLAIVLLAWLLDWLQR